MPEVSIHEACQRGDIDAVRALIAADPAAVDADDEHGWRPIFHAGLCRQEQVVRLLIGAGADLGAHDGYALHYASEVPDNKAIVSLLIQYGALDAHVRPPDNLSRQLLAAVFLADADRVRSLLVRHTWLAAAPDGRGDRPIHHAARTATPRSCGCCSSSARTSTPRERTNIPCCTAPGGTATSIPCAAPCREGRQCHARARHRSAARMARPVPRRRPLHPNHRSIKAAQGRGLTVQRTVTRVAQCWP